VLRPSKVESSSHRLLKRGWRQTLGRAALLWAIAAVISAIPVVRDAQVKVTDGFFRLGPPPRQPSQVSLVLIDDESLQQYGRWPWPRTRLAELNTKLAEAGASVIGLDILFAEPQSTDADHALAESLQASGRSVIVDKIAAFRDGSRWVEPVAEFGQFASIGHAHAVIDTDGVCRRFSPLQLTLDGPRWAFAIEVARRLDSKRTTIFLHAHDMPTGSAERSAIIASPALVRIPFRRDGFPIISAAAVLQGRRLGELKGRAVIVGFGSAELGDRVATPLSRSLPTTGVEVHAQIVDSILTGRTLHDVPWALGALFLALTCLITVVVFERRHGVYGLVWFGFLTASAYSIAFLLYLFAGRMLQAGCLLLAVMLGPLLVYGADFVHVERNLSRQLLRLRAWLQTHDSGDSTKPELSWKLQTLQDLQTELGALYELHRALLESTQDLIAIFDVQGNLILKNHLFSAACAPEWKNPSLDQFQAQLSRRKDSEKIENASSLDGEVYLGSELYSLRTFTLPPTSIAPNGGTILTLSSLRTREERDQARAEALAFVTHELRTPLTSIQGFAELMVQYPNSPSCRSAPEIIARESKRLLAMLNSYLNVLRLDAGQQSLQINPININEVVEQVFDILRPLAATNQMRLISSGDPAIAVDGDASLIMGAVLNLVSNAIKYGKLASDITVELRQQDNEAVIAVHNQSDAAFLEDTSRIFDLYYRIPSTEDTAAGWGLGLAFVKRIAEKHGGSVAVENPPENTTFELHLPVSAIAVRTREVPT
jgi:CHASE2 domain-containing sensor protein/signal transduction histidine kinase